MRQLLGLFLLDYFLFNLLAETRLHLLGVASGNSRSLTVSLLLVFASLTIVAVASAPNDKLLN